MTVVVRPDGRVMRLPTGAVVDGGAYTVVSLTTWLPSEARTSLRMSSTKQGVTVEAWS